MARDGIYEEVPGGAELIDWFGGKPGFHDAEIVGLDLRRRGESRLRLHFWMTSLDTEGQYIFDRHAVVTFVIEGIIDLQFEGFGRQNVIYGLSLRRALDRPERRSIYTDKPSPDDFEIELEPCYGMDGRIRCRQVRIELTPGMPEDSLQA